LPALDKVIGARPAGDDEEALPFAQDNRGESP